MLIVSAGRGLSDLLDGPAPGRVKGLTMMVNSVFNGWRMEEVRLDCSVGRCGRLSQ